MFSAIGQTLGKMFGTDKAVSGIINHTANAVDKIWYTDEEKAADQTRDTTEARKLVIAWLDSTKGTNVARRVLAFIIVGAWISLFLLGGLMTAACSFIPDPALIEQVRESSAILSAMGKAIGEDADMILIFYFGPHLMKAIGGLRK